MRERAISILAVLCCLFWASGCSVYPLYDSGRIPLQTENFPAGQKIVVVSMVYTTGWATTLFDSDTRIDHVDRVYIEFLDPNKPTLFGPEIKTYGSFPALFKVDTPGWAIFAPGVEPMLTGIGANGGAGLQTFSTHGERSYPSGALATASTAQPSYINPKA